MAASVVAKGVAAQVTDLYHPQVSQIKRKF